MTFALLRFINSMCSLAHAVGHSFGGAFHVPHGRSVGLFLPYTMEFIANAGNHRYADIACYIGLESPNESELSYCLIAAVRDLQVRLESNTNVASLGIAHDDYAAAMEMLLDYAENDTQIVASPRQPDRGELQKLFEYAYEGKQIDF